MKKFCEIEIDEADLGSFWRGSEEHLKEIAEMYEGELSEQYPDIEFSVIPILDSSNGAAIDSMVIWLNDDNTIITDEDGFPFEEIFEDVSGVWDRVLEKTPRWWWMTDDERVEIMKEFLTPLEVETVRKRWNGETLTSNERQTLHRIREKRDNALKLRTKLRTKIHFYENFNI